MCSSALGKRAEAAEAMRQGMALLQALAAEFPKVAAYRQDLASSHYNLGLLLQPIAERGGRRSWSTARHSLCENHWPRSIPRSRVYRMELARSHYVWVACCVAKQALDAEVELREALALRTQV